VLLNVAYQLLVTSKGR